MFNRTHSQTCHLSLPPYRPPTHSHNIGLHHSGENGAAYADNSCLMGATSYGDDGPKVCWNAAKSWESGWYAADSVTVDPTVGFDGLLVGAADFASNTYTPGEHNVVLQILDASRSQDFYVIFNRKKSHVHYCCFYSAVGLLACVAQNYSTLVLMWFSICGINS